MISKIWLHRITFWLLRCTLRYRAASPDVRFTLKTRFASVNFQSGGVSVMTRNLGQNFLRRSVFGTAVVFRPKFSIPISEHEILIFPASIEAATL